MKADRHRKAPLRLIAFAVLFMVALASRPGAVTHAQERTGDAPVVVELFTSQGCSSCPPADRLLGKLAARPDVIALTLPVDYWDYLDWKDTLGRAEHTKRQRHYAERLGLPTVYTPQMVIGGTVDAIGSRKQAVEEAIHTARKTMADAQIAVAIADDGEVIRVEVGPAPSGSSITQAKIIVIPALSARTVNIKRGENRGRTITYYNVSREIMPVGTWTGQAQTLELARDEVMIGETDRCAVILQDERSGAILGAAFL